jgi:YfiH family protein
MSNLIFQKELTENVLFEVYDDKPNFNYLKIHQTHSDIVLDSPSDKNIEGDGIVSSHDSNICVVTADCLPIAFIGENKYALIHAGWKGVQNCIIQHHLVEDINPNIIFIGPSIQSASFEVTDEFRSEFPNSQNYISTENKLYFDLQKEIRDQVRQKYPKAQVIDCKIDTMRNTDYHSYRRDKTSKRNFNCLRSLSKV